MKIKNALLQAVLGISLLFASNVYAALTFTLGEGSGKYELDLASFNIQSKLVFTLEAQGIEVSDPYNSFNFHVDVGEGFGGNFIELTFGGDADINISDYRDGELSSDGNFVYGKPQLVPLLSYLDRSFSMVLRPRMQVTDANPIASPVFEPEMYTMILIGLGVLGLTARRRKRGA